MKNIYKNSKKGRCPRILSASIMLVLYGSITSQVQAALPVDAVLAFDPGQINCVVGGTPPNCDFFVQEVTSSYFAFDANGDGSFEGNEKTPIERNEGVRLGDVQPALGSHPGLPDGSETPSIDMPWGFFGNTGMHQTTLPVVIVGGDDGAGDGVASIDFSGWGVTWNGILNIPLGGDGANFPSDTGIAAVSCSAGCNVGERFSLDYVTHVPPGDPSNFGGVPYAVHLEGVIDPGSPLPPTKSVSIALAGGNTHECSSTGGSQVEAIANIITTDDSDIVAVHWTLDGADAGSGEMASIFVPLGDHTVDVAVDTVASGTFESSEAVAVGDHTPPDLNIRFIDRRSGEEITEISGSRVHFVTVRYDVTDVCDPGPIATSGVAVPVYSVDDGDVIKIEHRKISTIRLNTSALNVSAKATDESGNQRSDTATLLTGD